jgi:hypothetical protein
MSLRRHTPIAIVDAVATGIALSCAAVGVWYMAGPLPAAGRRLTEFQGQASDLRQDVGDLQPRVARQAAITRRLEQELANRDPLLGPTQVEQNLSHITELARANRLQLVEVIPLSSVEYPGIHELRYHLTGRGRYADWLAFMGVFEQSPFWADITHLRLAGSGKSDTQPTDAVLQGAFTVSFFSTAEGGQDAEAT